MRFREKSFFFLFFPPGLRSTFKFGNSSFGRTRVRLGILHRDLYGLHEFVDSAHLIGRFGPQTVEVGGQLRHVVGRLTVGNGNIAVGGGCLRDQVCVLFLQAAVLALGPVDLGPQPVELVQQPLAAQVFRVRVAARLGDALGHDQRPNVPVLLQVSEPRERRHDVLQRHDGQLGAVHGARLQHGKLVADSQLLAGQHHTDLRDAVAEHAVDERTEVGQHLSGDAHQQRAPVTCQHGHIAEEPLQPRGLVDRGQRAQQPAVGRGPGRVQRRLGLFLAHTRRRRLLPQRFVLARRRVRHLVVPPAVGRGRRVPFCLRGRRHRLLPRPFVHGQLGQPLVVAVSHRTNHLLQPRQFGLTAYTRPRERFQPLAEVTVRVRSAQLLVVRAPFPRLTQQHVNIAKLVHLHDYCSGYQHAYFVAEVFNLMFFLLIYFFG